MIWECIMKSEAENSMYISRALKLLGVLGQRPVTVGALFRDLLKKSCKN